LVKKLWEINGNKKYSPNKFNDTLYNINPIFKNAKAVGPKDLVVFILDQFHKELKKITNNDNSNNSQAINQYDKINALNYFINDFKNNTSIISDIFFGVNETTTMCLNCKTIFSQKGLNIPICYDFGNFYFLSFPLEEIRNMKMNNSFNQSVQTINFNVLNLNDCFCYNQKSEYFTGENQNFCNICKLYYDSFFNSKIYVSPNVLILILDRGIENISDIKVYFTETINITQFVLCKESNSQLIYELYGVISEVNQDGSSQHFIASCKSPINNKWYKYDDTVVTPISNVQNEVIGFGNPYILFYQKNN
jgi:ubiquitin C-terminal hydrolase